MNNNLRSLLSHYKRITPSVLSKVILEYTSRNLPLLIMTKDYNYHIKLDEIDHYGNIFIGYKKTYISFDKEVPVRYGNFTYSKDNLKNFCKEILESKLINIK